jgi:hypothetical protein
MPQQLKSLKEHMSLYQTGVDLINSLKAGLEVGYSLGEIDPELALEDLYAQLPPPIHVAFIQPEWEEQWMMVDCVLTNISARTDEVEVEVSLMCGRDKNAHSHHRRKVTVYGEHAEKVRFVFRETNHCETVGMKLKLTLKGTFGDYGEYEFVIPKPSAFNYVNGNGNGDQKRTTTVLLEVL